MALNKFFNLQKAANEQNLVENLVVEAIQIYGMDVQYIPKTLVDFDKIYGEDAQRAFKATYTIEAYFENVDGFMGDKNFLSTFGLNIEKQATFVISKRRFDELITGSDATIVRPTEGDLIYLPLTHDLFEISFADHETVFYQLGKVYVWKLTCEKFRFSHETMDTGIAEIDKIAADLANNDSVANDPLADNDDIETRIENFLVSDGKSPFTE